MNEVIKLLKNRKSIRTFQPREIPNEVKISILQSAMEAPTAGNQQLYTILDITNQKLKETLSITCDNQPFIRKAPMVLIFCADMQKWFNIFQSVGANPRKPSVGDFMLAVDDAIIAAQNAVIAAESLGVGSCYIGDIMEECETHRELLQLPYYVFPAAMLVFGYPTEQQKNRKKPVRCKLDDIVHENFYHKKDESQLRQMFEHNSKDSSFDAWCQAFCNRKYNSDFSKEMGRSVSEYLRSFSD